MTDGAEENIKEIQSGFVPMRSGDEVKTMGAMSRNKGKVGEREWARFCTDRGYECHRTAQCRGDTGQAADVEGLPGIHIEVKRTESLRLYEAMRQSRHDAAVGDHGLPIVAHRKNEEDWVVIMDAEDWFQLYRAWEEAQNG